MYSPSSMHVRTYVCASLWNRHYSGKRDLPTASLKRRCKCKLPMTCDENELFQRVFVLLQFDRWRVRLSRDAKRTAHVTVQSGSDNTRLLNRREGTEDHVVTSTAIGAIRSNDDII